MNRQFEHEVFLKASPERVWQALTDPAQMAKWIGSPVEFEPRAGGKIHVQGLHEGVVAEFDPPRRLVWSWDPDNGTEPNRECMTLHPEDGGTRLHIQVEANGRWASDLMYFGGIQAGWLDWAEGLARWVHEGVAVAGYVSGLLYASLAAEEAAGGGQRLFVRTVRDGGSAERAGLKPGDTIRAYDGIPIDRVSTFWRIHWKSPPGKIIRLDLEREGQPVAAEVELGAPKAG